MMQAETAESDARRFKVVIAFDGTDFHGWQRQNNAEPTVQSCVEYRLRQFFGDYQVVRTIVNGRTDKGVSALGAVFHFDVVPLQGAQWLTDPRGAGACLTPQLLLTVLRNQPRPDIFVLSVEEVSPESFHARLSVRGKQYRYTILDGASAGGGFSSPFNARFCWALGGKVNLDIERMKRAALQLVGHRDFTHFAIMDEDENRSPLRNLQRLDVCRVETPEFEGDHESGCSQIGRVVIILEADFFLYKMCRKIVGTLVEVGKGSLDEHAVEQILRGEGVGRVFTAPANGLCLHRVFYDND